MSQGVRARVIPLGVAASRAGEAEQVLDLAPATVYRDPERARDIKLLMDAKGLTTALYKSGITASLWSVRSASL